MSYPPQQPGYVANSYGASSQTYPPHTLYEPVGYQQSSPYQQQQPPPQPYYYQGYAHQLHGALLGHWRAGFFSCFDQVVPTCCAAFWCAPCLTARFYDQFVRRGTYYYVLGGLLVFQVLNSTFSDMANKVAPDNKDDLPPKGPMTPRMQQYILYASLAGLFSMAVTLLGVGSLMMARTAMRKSYHIPGDGCTDCLVAWFCSCCTLAQMYRQMRDTGGCWDEFDCNDLVPAPAPEVITV